MTDKFISIEGIAKRYPGASGGEIGFRIWMNGSSAWLIKGDIPIRNPSGIATSTASR